MKYKSVAFLQLTERHTEVFGGLITLFKDLFEKLDFYYIPYQSDFSKYYKQIFGKDVKMTFHNLLSNPNISLSHNLYVFVTALEYIDNLDNNDYNLSKIPKNKILLLSHHADEIHQLFEFSSSVFAITPVYKKVPSFLTYFNLQKYTKNVKNNKINILLSGFTNPDNKDLNRLIKIFDMLKKQNNRQFIFHIINYYPLVKLKKYSDICKLYIDANSKTMMKLLNKSNYVMTLTKNNSSYHKKQLTGILPLAVSLGIPLIIDKPLAKIYGLSRNNSITYSFNNLKDTILSLPSISNEKYDKLKKNLSNYRKKMISYNKKKMKKMIQRKLKKLKQKK